MWNMLWSASWLGVEWSKNVHMIDARDCLALDAAKLYYVTGLGQAQVAKELGISRPTVSKLLSHARDKGFVTISLNDPREVAGGYVEKLCARYGLVDVRVVQSPAMGRGLTGELGNAGAALLEEVVKDGMTVGVSWGDTMLAVSEHLRTLPLVDVKVVQLKGGHSHTARNTNDMVTLTRFSRALNAEMMMLPLPVILDSKEAKELVVKDWHIASMLDLGAHCDVAVFTVGAVKPESLLLNLGYLSPSEQARLMEHAVGDVCSRFYDAQGEVADPDIDARTVGISLADLKKRPVRVLVAGGLEKAPAIEAALRTGVATHVVIDHATAQRVVEMA